MLANFHTHSLFCDGKNTPEEIVRYAIERGFTAIGFSGHGYTPFDERYCMRDTEGYIRQIQQLKCQYADQIEIYLGTEEDAFAPTQRDRYDYIIGSSHYFHIGQQYLPIDSGYSYFQACLEAFSHDTLRLAETYYSTFCDYIRRRKPDVIGHFDLITKFDEKEVPLFLQDPAYQAIARRYARLACQSGCLFEVNTGAVSRGYRTGFYPSVDLLYVLKKEDAKLILSSDSHRIETLDFGFADARRLLRDIGFTRLYTLRGAEAVPCPL